MMVSLWNGCQSESTSEEDVLTFEIGKEDKSEFPLSDFTGVHDYECTAGKDCDPETLPVKSYRMSAVRIGDYYGVAGITIRFSLKRDYEEVVLRLARWGAETDVVTVDGKKTHIVTNTMLGSYEDVYGVYDLKLGALDKGRHNILITVAEDGRGNGRHDWDAITLIAK
jgi:hypothetical protein